MTDSSGNGQRFVLTDEGEFLRLRWNAGIVLELRDVHASSAAVASISAPEKRPLLVHIDMVDGISAEARDFLLEETSSSRTAVLGMDEVSRVMTAFNYRAATPSRYFYTEPEAIEWLLAPGTSSQDLG